MSTSLTLSLAPVDLLAVAVKALLVADTKIDDYRVRVERVPIMQEAVTLVPGCILVAPTRLSSDPLTGCYKHTAGIGMLFPFVQDSKPLADDQPGPGTLVDVVMGMVEDWNKTITTSDGTAWSFDGSESTIFDAPEIEGPNKATGRTLIGFLVVLTYHRQRFKAQ